MNKTSELLKNTVVISIGKMGTQIVSFLLLPLYTSKLSTDTYGTFDYVIAISSFLVPIMTMLMEESMFRFLIDCKSQEDKESVISNTFIYCICNGLVVGIVIVFFSYIFDYKLGYAILIYCLSSWLVALSNALARGTENIVLYSFSNFVGSVLVIVLNLIFILGFQQGFWALMISSCMANFFSATMVVVKLSCWRFVKLRKLDKKTLKSMLKYSVFLVPNSISWSVINASDRMIIMNYVGASANGVYSMACKFPNLINTFYNFFNVAWRERAAKIVRDKEFNEFEIVYETVRNVLFAVTILFMSVLRYIYPIFVNSQYMESIVYVPILTISSYYMSLSAFYGGVFTAYKQTAILGITSMIAAIINLFVDVLCFSTIGVYAAAVSTLMSALFLYFYRKIKIRVYMNAFRKSDIVIVTGFVCACLLFYSNSVTWSVLGVGASVVLAFGFNAKVIVCLFKTKKRI